MLSDIIGNDKILLQENVKDWKEAIQLAAEPLLKNDYISSEYISAMINSVINYGPYIVIAKGVALAHARSEDGVYKMGLSILTTKNAICFGNEENDPVRIIFCLAAPDSTTHIEVMRSLVNLINEDWKISKLTSINDKSQFIELLNKLEENNI